MSPRKVLLIGGTGTMGVYLSQFLVEAGCDVYVTSRKALSSGDDVHYLQGDGHSLSFISSVLNTEHPDVVVDFMDYATEDFKRNKEVLLRSCSQYIFLSSYRVYANSEILTESSPRLLDVSHDELFLSTDEYALRKARSENVLFESDKNNWTIVRPGIIYSDRCLKFGCLEANAAIYRVLRNLPVVMPTEMLSKKTNLTFAKDAAMLIYRLVANEQALGKVYNVATPEGCTWQDVASVYQKELGLKVADVSVEQYCDVCANAFQVKYDRMYDRVIDVSSVLNDTGTNAREFACLSEGLGEALRGFKNHPRYPFLDLRCNAKQDRLCRCRMSFDGLTFKQRYVYLLHRYPWVEQCVAPILKIKNKMLGRD